VLYSCVNALLYINALLCCTTIVTQLTEHDDVIKSLLRGAPRLGLALAPAPARAGPDHSLFYIDRRLCKRVTMLPHAVLQRTSDLLE